jgi:hypothetical protein
MDAKDCVNALFSAICRSDEVLRWHAISGMGASVARLAGEDLAEARIVMRRFLWSLNDESGGIGWGAPESMAEAMHHQEQLAREYIHMLVSYTRGDGEELFEDGNYLEHETLQQGLLWGIGRLAGVRSVLLHKHLLCDDLTPYLSSSDGTVRGLAARALGLFGDRAAQPQLRAAVDDPAKVRLYDEGVFIDTCVGELARQALADLE